MKSRSHRKQLSVKSLQPRSGRRTAAMVAGFFIAIVVIWGVWTYWNSHSITPEANSSGPSSEKTVSSPSDSIGLPAAADQLKGRWVRPDGGYILEINRLESNGSMEARYYNPRPIRVSRATVSNADGVAKIFIELRDTGYPGATYNLLYKSRDDLLVGSYYQPAVGQTFDVIFMRHKPAQ